jgi:hypothetical protein
MAELTKEEEIEIVSSFKVAHGFKKRTWIGVVYGGVKTGKSFLAKESPNPFYIPIESGAMSVPDVARFDTIPTTFDEVLLMLRCASSKKWAGNNVLDVDGNPMPIKTIVIDSLSALQRLIWDKVIKENPKISRGGASVDVTSIEDYDYGHGYLLALTHWERFMRFVGIARDNGYNILLICHSAYRNINDEQGTRKFLDLDLVVYGAANTVGVIAKDADWIYLIKSEVCVKKMTANKQDKRMIGTEERPIRRVYTRETNLFLAGVRAEHEEKIPDCYDLDYTGEAARQLFKDLEG